MYFFLIILVTEEDKYENDGGEYYYDDEEDTLVSNNNNSQISKHYTMPSALNQVPTDWEHLPVKHFTVAGDDRPITPMKNKMVYDVKNSTLDYEDGRCYMIVLL